MSRIHAVSFFPAARHELQDAVSYYNEQCAGLGFEFAAEVRRTLSAFVAFLVPGQNSLLKPIAA